METGCSNEAVIVAAIPSLQSAAGAPIFRLSEDPDVKQ